MTRLMVIGAHAADFVWRAGGVIAVTTANEGVAQVIALSYGERGESGELWKEEGQTVEVGTAHLRFVPLPAELAPAEAAPTEVAPAETAPVDETQVEPTRRV